MRLQSRRRSSLTAFLYREVAVAVMVIAASAPGSCSRRPPAPPRRPPAPPRRPPAPPRPRPPAPPRCRDSAGPGGRLRRPCGWGARPGWRRCRDGAQGRAHHSCDLGPADNVGELLHERLVIDGLALRKAMRGGEEEIATRGARRVPGVGTRRRALRCAAYPISGVQLVHPGPLKSDERRTHHRVGLEQRYEASMGNRWTVPSSRRKVCVCGPAPESTP